MDNIDANEFQLTICHDDYRLHSDVYVEMHMDLRTQATSDESWADMSQRMLNAIEPGSVVPVHRHRKTSETVVVLRGRVVEEYYDDAGVLVESFVLGDCHVADAPMAYALNIPAGQWHTLRALESGTVILEMKDGAYEPIGPEDILSM